MMRVVARSDKYRKSFLLQRNQRGQVAAVKKRSRMILPCFYLAFLYNQLKKCIFKSRLQKIKIKGTLSLSLSLYRVPMHEKWQKWQKRQRLGQPSHRECAAAVPTEQ